VIDIEMLFPAAKESFDIPSQLVNGHNFFRVEIE
jgi:hypothetical protein